MFASGWKLFDNLLQYLAIFDIFWYLLTTFGNFWQLFAKFGNFCQVLAPLPFLTTWQLLSSYLCHFRQLLATLATFVILLYCPLVILSSCHIVILSSRHFVLFSSCQSGSLSICQLINCLACELLSLWTFHIAHLRACKLVLHITNMISFGGFLAECLPC